MSVTGLRAAFNSAVQPQFSCATASLTYERANGTEWQRLWFSGTSADGVPFQIKSDRLRAETDLIAAAKAVGEKLIAQQAPPAQGETTQ
jgi:hypothetical protein